MPWDEYKRIQDLISEETNLVSVKNFKSVPINIALVYPNSYMLGMSNLGFQSIYEKINSRCDSLCHRAFFSYGKNDISAATIEASQPIQVYDIVGFSVSFEMDYINVLGMLDKSNIPLLAKDREKPIVMAGGPAVTFNPEPLSPFIDFFVIGEGEEVIEEIIETYNDLKDLPKKEILEGLSKIQGVYVPSLYKIYYEDTPKKDIKVETSAIYPINKRWVRDLDEVKTETVVLTPKTEFGNMFLLEVSRGCGRNCRFCMAGYCYRVPRVRSLEKIIERAEHGKRFNKKLGLVGAAISDYPYIDQLTQYFIDNDIQFSVSSLRADSLTETLVQGLAMSGHRTLTIAPDAASQRIRDIINKGITEQHIFDSILLSQYFGINNIKLYFIIGLPTEEDRDIDEMIDFLIRVKEFMKCKGNKSGKLSISINPFIPKPFTPFQWLGMEDVKTLNDKIKKIKSRLKPAGIRVIFESPRLSEIQAALARVTVGLVCCYMMYIKRVK